MLMKMGFLRQPFKRERNLDLYLKNWVFLLKQSMVKGRNFYWKAIFILNLAQEDLKKISDRDRRLICRLSGKDPFMSAGKIKFEIGRNDLSTKTIKRVLFKSGGLKTRMAAKKPYLRNTNRLNRLRWAREHQNWTIDQ